MKRINLIVLAVALAAACGTPDPDPVKPVSLSAPTGVKLNRETDHSLIFQWDAAQNAETYSWKLLEGSTEVQKGQTRNTNAIIDALTKGTTYRFTVRAEAGESASGWSDYVEGIPGGKPGPVDDLTQPRNPRIPYRKPYMRVSPFLRSRKTELRGPSREPKAAVCIPPAEGEGRYSTLRR